MAPVFARFPESVNQMPKDCDCLTFVDDAFKLLTDGAWQFPWMRHHETFGYPPKCTEARATEPATSAALLGAGQVRRAEISIRDL
ncbi:hypothetical protein ABZU32_33400 [Sphaerisporangium sp. NPDC005288]|uniref:hypothetical protein n=1 Tax=Sphaerisporangium sp. NPDC005288 TaxID=3155114 RepID=UPI0033A10378